MYNRFTFPNREDDFLRRMLTRQEEVKRPTVPVANDLGPVETPAQPAMGLLERFNQINNNRPIRSELMKMLGEQPNREDFKPHWSDRVESALSGVAVGWNNPAAGVAAARGALDRNFNTATSDYDNRLNRTSMLAGLEGDDIDQRMKSFEFERGLDKDAAADKDRALDNDRADRILAQNIEEAKSAGWSTEVGSDGATRAFKQGQEPKVLGRFNESIEQIRKREDQVRASEQAHRERLNKDAIEGRAAVAQVRAKSLSDKIASTPLDPAQQLIGVGVNLSKLAAQGINVDEFVDYDEATKRYSLKNLGTMVSWRMSPEDKAIWEAQRKLVLEALNPPTVKSGNVTPAAPGGTEYNTQSEPRVKMWDNSKQPPTPVTLPQSQVEAAKAMGYTVR